MPVKSLSFLAIVGLMIGHTVLAAPGVPKIGPPKATKPEGPVRVMTAMSTPLKSGHPILFLNGAVAKAGGATDPLSTRLQFPPDQRYSKWSVIFESPVRIETVEVSTCDGAKQFSDGVELYIDHSEKRLYSDGGRRTVKFKVKQAARALTLNFLESAGLCLENVRLRTSTEWMRPRTILATGDGVLADGAIGVSPRTIVEGKKTKVIGARKAGEWALEWENPLIIERLVIWNGNQRVGDTFLESDRVRDLEIRGDDGKTSKVTLEDRRFYQHVDLADPHPIRTLALKSQSTYAGTLPSEPMLGEVQFSAGGENWIPIIPVTAVVRGDSGESAQAEQIRERGYGDMLDRELRVDERGDIWKFRFRSDGTFFARIFVDQTRTARAWSASGTWHLEEKSAPEKEVKMAAAAAPKNFLRAFSKTAPTPEAAPVAGLKLSLVGTKMVTSDAVDSLPCANHCYSGIEDRGPSAVREFPVLEQVELQRDKRSVFTLRNRTEPEKRTIDFSDLRVRIHSLYD